MPNDIQLTNCFIKTHKNQVEPMFDFHSNDSITIRLNKMAIVPLDEYQELVAIKNSLEINKPVKLFTTKKTPHPSEKYGAIFDDAMSIVGK